MTIGQPINRIDGPLKVSGRARFSAEFSADRIAYGVLVQSTVARGRITQMDTVAARRAPGVLYVMTHQNAPALPQKGTAGINPPAGRTLSLLQDDTVHYNGASENERIAVEAAAPEGIAENNCRCC